MKPEIIVAVKSLLLHNRKALLLRRQNTAPQGPGIWEFTGGKLEFGETLQQALLREIREETGLVATIDKLLYAVTLRTGPARQIVVINYLTHAAAGKVQLSGEHQAYHWATQQEMLDMLDPDIVKNLNQFNVFQQVDISTD
ncbi:NUDIX domain-containing protein [Ruminococcaceae bacterium OttesenSCG-928-A16]|nr:NUDIX domain-containing protein [Ruminococcaceae bacterium OttesenSCG-928-A16]